MASNNKTALQEARTYKNLIWLGLLSTILAVIFGCIAISKLSAIINDAKASKAEREEAAALKSSAISTMIGVIVIPIVIVLIIWALVFGAILYI